MQLVCFFKDMQLFNVTLNQNSKLDSLRLALTFQIENPLSCRRVWKVDLLNICKNEKAQDLSSTVTVNKHTIIDQKSYCCFGKFFILAMVNWIQCCTQCFFKSFWVSKWHPKILQWHPKFWKPRYGFALYWSKTNWDKHVFLHVDIATDGCNVIGRQFSGAEAGSENCKFGICALSCAPLPFGLLLYCPRFVQYGVRNCESTLMQIWKCFTVSPLRSACLAMHQTTMKTKGQQLQRASKTRWLSSEATARGKRFEHGAFLLSTLAWHLTWQNWAKFFRRYVLTLHMWKLP